MEILREIGFSLLVGIILGTAFQLVKVTPPFLTPKAAMVSFVSLGGAYLGIWLVNFFRGV